jgi:predicted regulator of Ras-like GTPase activity (Roadblock/LC7/MglB family)
VHWLADRVAAVAAQAPGPGSGADARRAFLAEIGVLVDETARRPGVDAAFASYDGLLVAVGGVPTAEAEPFAALAQSVMDPVHVGALGPLQQLLLVGAERKLALLRIGPVTVGLMSRSGVRLAESTAR